MRIRVIEVEGSPEELVQIPQLMEALSQPGPAAYSRAPTSSAGLAGSSDADSLPEDIRRMLDERGPRGPIRTAMEGFLTAVVDWGDVDFRIGVSKTGRDGLANVIRLHRRGSRVGAFVYLGVGGNLKFRLPRSEDLTERAFARARDVQPGAPYGVAMKLVSKDVVPEAVQLARKAYEGTIEPGG
jgi:hypothetical protein